jgi:hypothetical protein
MLVIMTTLTDDEIKDLVQKAADRSGLAVEKDDIHTAPAIDSDGLDAVEVVISIPPQPLDTPVLAPSVSSTTVVQVHLGFAQAGEERMPIVWFGEKRAS